MDRQYALQRWEEMKQEAFNDDTFEYEEEFNELYDLLPKLNLIVNS